MLTEKAIEEFMTSRGGLRPMTQQEYRKHLAQFQKVFPRLPKNPQPIQSWLNSFSGLAPETIHSRFRTIRTFYRQIHLWRPNIPNPMPLVRPPILHPKAMRTFADSELHRLFNRPLSSQDQALLTLLLDTGPRATECANLVWNDVSPGFVVLRGKTGERIVPVSETTYRLLLALKPTLPPAAGDRHVFMGKRGPLSYQGIYRRVRRLCNQAGITGRRCSPHTFRHTFGTDYAAADGCDPKVLQDILGHRDFKTTLRYIQNNPRRMAVNHSRCTPLKGLAAAAQGNLFREDSVISEAEAIVARMAKLKL